MLTLECSGMTTQAPGRSQLLENALVCGEKERCDPSAGASVPTPAPKRVAHGWGRQQDVPWSIQASGRA